MFRCAPQILFYRICFWSAESRRETPLGCFLWGFEPYLGECEIRTFHTKCVYLCAESGQKSGKLKDRNVIDTCEDIIREWRQAVTSLGSAVDAMSCAELVAAIKQQNKDTYGFRLDFVEYIRKVAAKKKKASTAHTYRIVANSLERYADGAVLDVSAITSKLLREYEQWLRDEGIAPTTIYLYMSQLKAVHNAARAEYNDEDGGKIRIPQTSFTRYKMPTLPAPSARGVDLATLQAIANLEDEKRINSRRNFGRDMVMLSFALGGMNYADLWSLAPSALHGDYIEYRRQKTKDSRGDGALYRVRIEPEVLPLVERYRDRTGAHLFNFHLRYTEKSFKIVVSQAVNALEESVPYSRHYTYYAARHTYASLARNAVGLDKYTVHELLNHSDNEMRITYRYIECDWQRLFDAHRKVITLVDWSKIG